MTKGQLVQVRYLAGKGWLYGVVVSVFDDRVEIISEENGRRMELTKEITEREKEFMQDGIMVIPLYRNGQPIMCKKVGIFKKRYLVEDPLN